MPSLSILRKASEQGFNPGISGDVVLSPKEIRLVKLLSSYPSKVREAADGFSPAVLANYSYDLAKEFNQYYHETPVLKEQDTAVLAMRLGLVSAVARVLSGAMGLLGIELPERM